MTEPGSFIGRHEVLRKLGHGGMGEVYLVRNVELNRLEAMKVISVDGPQREEFRARFIREAQAVASLDHPGIVTIFQYGIADDGRPWYTMTYLDGQDLSAVQLPVHEVVAVVSRVADALDYAHSRGMVHRDVKPANIMVTRTPDGRLDRVVLVDFGIAKLAGLTDLTATHGFVGTLNFTAPEVFANQPATPASDQYSLGCTAFYLLSGRPPFAASSLASAVGAHTSQPVPSIGTFRNDVSVVDPVLNRALAKVPERRFASSREFAFSLQKSLSSYSGFYSSSQSTLTPYAPTAHAAADTVRLDRKRRFRRSRTSRRLSRKAWAGLLGTALLLAAAVAGTGVLYWRGGASTEEAAAARTLVASRSIAAGLGVVCVVVGDEAKCLGSGGDIGDGSSKPRFQPVSVRGLEGVTAISVGAHPTQANEIGTRVVCAVAEGVPYCWGQGSVLSATDIGAEDPAESTVPRRVDGLPDSVDVVKSSGSTACALSRGDVYCWGIWPGRSGVTVTPSLVPSLRGASDISVSNALMCAAVDGRLKCWGVSTLDGLLGGPASVYNEPVVVPGFESVTQVSVGSYAGYRSADSPDKKVTAQNICAVSSGDAYCWGVNAHGQVGDGTTMPWTKPLKVPNLSEVSQIETVGQSTCAISVGELYCWGSNEYGQLGDGTKEGRLVPTKVRGLSGEVLAVSMAMGTTCARVSSGSGSGDLSDSSVYCWGVDPNAGDDILKNLRLTPVRQAF